MPSSTTGALTADPGTPPSSTAVAPTAISDDQLATLLARAYQTLSSSSSNVSSDAIVALLAKLNELVGIAASRAQSLQFGVAPTPEQEADTNRIVSEVGELLPDSTGGAASGSVGTATVEGVVALDNNGTAGNVVPGATVSVRGKPELQVVTGKDGRFAINGLTEGYYTLSAQALGYSAETDTYVVAGQPVTADLFLRPTESTSTGSSSDPAASYQSGGGKARAVLNTVSQWLPVAADMWSRLKPKDERASRFAEVGRCWSAARLAGPTSPITYFDCWNGLNQDTDVAPPPEAASQTGAGFGDPTSSTESNTVGSTATGADTSGFDAPPEESGEANGEAVDENGDPIADADVVVVPEGETMAAGFMPLAGTLSSSFQRRSARTRTDSQGRYRFDRLPAGSYQLVIKRPGFKQVVRRFTVQRRGSAPVGTERLLRVGGGRSTIATTGG